MMVTAELAIGAPPQAVYEAATDFARWPQFMSGVTASEMATPGPAAVGARFRQTRTMHGRSETEEMTIAALEPPRRVLLTARAHGTRYRVEHTFEPHGAGTHATLAFAGEPETLLARLLTPLALLFRGAVRSQLARDLADIAREAERRAGG